MKKKYMKPEMTVAPLRHRTKLLVGSTGPKMQSARTNLGNDAIEYGGGGYEESR